MSPTEHDLREFLRHARLGVPPLEALPCGRAKAWTNPLSCPAGLAAELAAIANRPLPGLTLYKLGSRSIVGSFRLGDDTPVVLKYYSPSRIHKHLSYGINGSRCMRSWITALGFQFLGIPTPAPLVIAEWHLLGGLWLSKSFLATRRAEGVNLFEWVKRHGQDEARLRLMAERLHGIFQRMAEYRISHGDLKASNIVIGGDDSPSFIDLDGTSFLQSPDAWKSQWHRDSRRFLKNWNQHPAAGAVFDKVMSRP